MAINKNHMKYDEYIEKCKDIGKRQDEEISRVKITYGFDGPTTAIYKKYAEELKKLQKEYSFLFEED